MLNFISTMTSVRQLIEISHFYGSNKDFVIAGGGNTSFKDDKFMWIKASGAALSTITEDGFAILDRARLKLIATKRYSEYPDEREKQIKNDLFRASVYPERNQRPSLETSFHEMMNYHFVVHTHPTLVNALMCSMDAESKTSELFGEKAIFVPYADPGYMLFKKVEAYIASYREKFNSDPNIIFLQNHGVFVAANTIDEVKLLYSEIISTIGSGISQQADTSPLPIKDEITRIIPAIRMMLTEKTPKTIIVRHHHLIRSFYESAERFQRISLPLTPDAILYCNTRALYIENTSIPEDAVKEALEKIEAYKRSFKSFPKILVLKNIGFISVDDHYKSAEIALDAFEDQMKISFLSEGFGGPKFMNDREISFIKNQAIDNMQRLLLKDAFDGNHVARKTVVMIDGTDDLGVGIAEDLMLEHANVVVAGLNEAKGNAVVTSLNAGTKENRAVFVKTDVSDSSSIKNLFFETINNFGGLDVFIHNIGGIKSKNTKPNSNVDYRIVSDILKLQAGFKSGYFTDMIQIQAQPGLDVFEETSQSTGNDANEVSRISTLSLELISYGIKVNSISPGNFFDSPEWSDPQSGLFLQYMAAGNISNATTVGELKAAYEKKNPAGRGCKCKDVLRAVYYLIEQEYETGQVIKVTGGQQLL